MRGVLLLGSVLGLITIPMHVGEPATATGAGAGAASKPSLPLGARKVEAPPVWTYKDFQDGKIPQTYTIRKDHPRLLITAENKADLVDKIKAAPEIWRRVIAAAQGDPGKAEPQDHLLACAAIYQLGLVAGFEYALTRQEYGQEGVTALMAIEGEQARSLQFGIAFGYDWLFDLLTAEQKKALAERMIKAAPTVVGEGGNCIRGLGIVLGLAFHGDGVDDTAAAEIVNHMFKDVWWNPKIENSRHNWLIHVRYLEGGGGGEGIGYFSRHWPTFPMAAAWKTATGQDYFARLGYFRNMPYWMTHSVAPRPATVKGNFSAMPAHNYADSNMWPPSYDRMMAAASGFLKDIDPAGAALARWWVDHGRSASRARLPYEDMPEALVYGLLIGDPRVQTAPAEKLGLPPVFVMPGLNEVHLRSAWDDVDATCIFFGNTRARMRSCVSNEFMLWKNGGPLFLFRGGIAHHYYWGGGGWADNNVIFFDGARRISPFATTVTTDVQGTLLTASEPSQYDFARGECAQAYIVPQKGERGAADIVQAQRTLVYLRPTGTDKTDHVIILDRTETKSPAARPHVVFNMIFEPKLARDWNSPDQGKPGVPGRWDYDQASCAIVTNEHDYAKERGGPAHARAFMKTLYPPQVKMIKSGGEQHPLDDLEGECKIKGLRPSILTGGYWRFHVVPAVDGTKHTILHAIEATDSKVTKPGTLELLESEQVLGALAGTNIVLFSKSGQALTAGSVKVPHAGTYRLVLADLPGGAGVTVTAGGTSIRLTATPGGTAHAAQVKLSAGEAVTIGK